MARISPFTLVLAAVVAVGVDAGPCNVNNIATTADGSSTSELDSDPFSTSLSLNFPDDSSTTIESSSETSSTAAISVQEIPASPSLSSSEATTTTEPSSSEPSITTVPSSLEPTTTVSASSSASASASASSSLAPVTTAAPSVCQSWIDFEPYPPRLTCYQTGTLISREKYVITTLAAGGQRDICQQACVDTPGRKAAMIDFDNGYKFNLLPSPVGAFSVTRREGGVYWDVGCRGCSGVSTTRTSQTCTSVTSVEPKPPGARCYQTGTLLSKSQLVITTLPAITYRDLCNVARDNTDGCYAAMLDFDNGYACGLLRSLVQYLSITSNFGRVYWDLACFDCPTESTSSI